MTKKVAVTGAGGYIGRHVVTALCNEGAAVTAVVRHSAEIDPRAKIVKIDIFEPAENIFADLGCPDACIHMAWKDGFNHNSDTHMAQLSAHYLFIKRMLEGGLKQLAIMGTMHEVGYYVGAVDENTPCNPMSMYGIAKDALRRSCFQLVKDKNVYLQWLRAFYICGDDEKNHSIFSKITEAEHMGQEFFPLNSGKNKYDFIDVDELARQIAATAMQTEVHGVINCCSGRPISLGEKVEQYIKEREYKIVPQYGVFSDRPYDSPAIWGDTTKIVQIMTAQENSLHG